MKKQKPKFYHRVLTFGREIALVSAILLIVSAFLPWGSTENVSVSGLYGDGKIIIGLGLLAFVLLFVKKSPRVISLFLGIAALVSGILDLREMQNVVVEISGQVGSGLYIGILASVGMILGTIADMVRKSKEKLFYIDCNN